MILTIDTDKKHLVIEKATVQEVYEYVAKLDLLDYSIVTKKEYIPYYGTYKPELFATTKATYHTGDQSKDISKTLKTYFNIT